MAYEVDFLMSYDRESLVAELQRVAKKLGKVTLTWNDIDNHARTDARTMWRKFGSMQMAHMAAGLVPPRHRLSDDEMLGMLADLWKITYRETGRSPSLRDLDSSGLPVSRNGVIVRFGSWKKALAAAAKAAPGELSGQSKKNKTSKRVERRAKTRISIRKRFLVFQRDGYKCRICGHAGGELEVDHVIPVCRGGKNTMENLQTLCRKCNRGKGGSLQ